MKKMIAFMTAGLMLSSTAYATQQADSLATWVKDSNLSLNDIATKAQDFDKNMNDSEGITCIAKGNNGYVILAHPNPAKAQKTAPLTEEENKVLAQVFTAVDGKPRTEGVPVTYVVNTMKKDGVAYLIEKDNFCMAYWVTGRG